MKRVSKAGYVLLSGLLLFTSACTDEEEQPVYVPDVVEPIEITLDTDSEVYLGWDDFYSKDDITFSIDSFSKTDTLAGQLFTQHFTPDDSFYLRFANLLVYNEDSSMFIDPYSGSWIIEIGKDGKQYAREGEIDQEVAVVNTKTNTRTRLLFCGPSCIIQKAFWYNEDIVGVMGLMGEYADEYYTPTIWFVNIHNGITLPYHYNSSISIIQANKYTERYLKSKGVQMAY